MTKKPLLLLFLLSFLLIPFASVQATTNLLSVECGHWYTDSDWQLAPIRDMQVVTKDGLTAWEVPLSVDDWGVDHAAFNCSPGQTITFTCKIQTSNSTIGGDLTMAGGRIGCDVYGAEGASRGLSDPDGTGDTAWNHHTYVTFGTDEWTQVTMTFTLPTIYQANQVTHEKPIGTIFTPYYIIPWVQTWNALQGTNEHGTAWFADPVFTITDLPAPTNTFSPLNPANTEPINPAYILLGLAGMGLVLYHVIKGKN